MNWTGGRLQRHSKAHANKLLRAQRDHFARARLRSNNRSGGPSPFQFSIVKIRQDQQTETKSPALHQRTLHDYEPGGRSEETRGVPCKGNHNHLEHPSDQDKSARVAPHIRQSISSQNRISATPEVHTLADVKRSLLKRSDWMGLDPARPAKIEFTPAVELESVGRRRRVTTKDLHRRQNGTGGHRVHHSILKPFQDPRDRLTRLTDHSDSFSIRVGSNIHQSQTVQLDRRSETLSPASSEIVSTDSMLLDRLEAKLPKNPLLPKQRSSADLEEELHLEPIREKDEHFEVKGLVPLEKARSFASFADLQVHSSSNKQWSSISPLNAPSASVQRVARGPRFPKLDASRPFVHGYVAVSSRNPGESLPGSGSKHEGNSPGQYRLGSRQSRAADAVLSERSSIRMASGPGISDLRETGTRAAASIKDVADEAQVNSPSTENGLSGTPGDRSLLYTQATRPLYTLEHQVELEVQPRRQPRNLRCASQENNSTNRTELVQSDLFDRPMTSRESQATISGFSNADSLGSDHAEIKPAPSSRCVKRATNSETGGDQQGPYSVRHSYSAYNSYSPDSFMTSPIYGASDSGEITHESPAPLVVTGKFASRQQGGQNEACIRDRFSDDFGIMQKQFTFGNPSLAKHRNSPVLRPLLSRDTLGEERSISKGGDWKQDQQPSLPCSGSAESFKTSANTVLNAPCYRTPDKALSLFQTSETDFLTEMSPMEGCLDERIIDVSTYNNAPRTERSFIQKPSFSIKRSAFDAFGAVEDESASQSLSQSIARSVPNLMASHRRPLQVLHQPGMRHQAHYKPVTNNQIEWEGNSCLGWNYANGQQLTKSARSALQVRYMQTSSRKSARTPSNYPTLAESATCQRLQSSIEKREDITGAPNCSSMYHTSSSLNIPRHRTPLDSVWASDHMDVCDDEQTINHSGAAAATSSSITHGVPPFRTQAELRRHGQAEVVKQTSSSSSIFTEMPAPCIPNIHASNAAPFVFRRPQRLNGPFSRPQRDAAFFKQPAPDPVYLH